MWLWLWLKGGSLNLNFLCLSLSFSVLFLSISLLACLNRPPGLSWPLLHPALLLVCLLASGQDRNETKEFEEAGQWEGGEAHHASRWGRPKRLSRWRWWGCGLCLWLNWQTFLISIYKRWRSIAWELGVVGLPWRLHCEPLCVSVNLCESQQHLLLHPRNSNNLWISIPIFSATHHWLNLVPFLHKSP